MTKELTINLDKYSTSDDEISLLLYIEKNSLVLRNKYLNYIYDLGEKKIKRSNLINLLKFDEFTSFWWMSLFTEKSYLKSESINNFIKFIAINEILKKKKIDSKINFINADKSYSYLIEELCRLNKWKYKINYKNKSFYLFIKKLLRSVIPSFILSLLYLLRFIFFNLLVNFNNRWHQNIDSQSITIFGHLAHIDKSKLDENTLYLDHFGELAIILKEKKINVNWFYNYIKSENTPNIFSAKKIINKYNIEKKSERHNIIGHNISLKLLRSIIFTYFKIYYRFFFTKKYKKLFFYNKDNLNCWPLFKDDWNDSIYGTNLIKNIIWLHIFDEILSQMPYQKVGIYAQENQGWEKALITRWKKYSHGDLIAFNHTFMRFWDTRYYDEKRTIKNNFEIKIPQPDYIAINGPYCLNEYINQGYDKNQLVEVEAIRYSKYNNHEYLYNNNSFKNILVLPSYKNSFSYAMLECLSENFLHSKNKYNFDIKMHPASKLDPSKINIKYRSIIKKNIIDIYKDYDLMITCSDSGAAIDGYILGIPVITFREDGLINYSPLKNLSSDIFFSSSEELKKIIELLPTKKSNVNHNIFWFNKNNSKWKTLLSNYF